jgi:hypothetical protein
MLNMTTMVAILLSSNGPGFWEFVWFTVFIIYIIGWLVQKSNNEKKIANALLEYQKSLNGTDKKKALAKGRYYVSLLPQKSQMLAEISIQNDLNGMDDAIKLKKK